MKKKFPMPETSGRHEIARGHFIQTESGETVELLIPLRTGHPWMHRATEDGDVRFVIPRSAIYIFKQAPINGQIQVSIGPHRLTLLASASTYIDEGGCKHTIGRILTAWDCPSPSEKMLEHLDTIHNSRDLA